MTLRMEHKFTFYFRKHSDHSYTVRVVEIPNITAHGTMKERCIDDLKAAIRDYSKYLDPDDFDSIKQIQHGEFMQERFIFQPAGLNRRRRKSKVQGKISIIVYPFDNQYLVVVPVLNPQLRFFADTKENIPSTLKQELDTYFHENSVEEIISYIAKNDEWLEIFNIRLFVRSPQEVLKNEYKKKYKAFTEIADNVTLKARDKKFDRAFEVKDQVNELMQVLSSENRKSILIIGETQSGKSAVINEAAYLISRKRCAESLKKREIWKTSPSRLDSHHLPIEMLFRYIINYCEEENTVLWFEDLASVLQTNTTFIKGNQLAGMLNEPLRNGELVIIGEITPAKYEQFISSNAAFISNFHLIRMPEYDNIQSKQITNQVRKRLEMIHSLTINPNSISIITELTGRFQPYWHFPGKAVNLLKEVVNSELRKDENCNLITKETVYKVFSEQTGLPENLISDHPPLKLEVVRDFFESRILGQSAAIEKIIDLISTIKAGLNDPSKPLGNFIFLGPTGVGKTYLAKSLAKYLFGSEKRMIRFDMSEYSSPDAVYKLLGIAGSSGRDGFLTQKIMEQPFSLLLFDEIEKASDTVFDLFLQILGEGRITGSDGTTVDFRSAIIIMTSNLGASSKELQSVGFGKDSHSNREHYLMQMEKFFRPEFINRIDYIVPFENLTKDSVRKIAEYEIEKAITRYGIQKRQITLEVDEEITELIIKEGFSSVYGARPVKRAIERILMNPLARHIATHKESQTQLLRVSYMKGEIIVNSVSVKKPRVKIAQSDPFRHQYKGVELPELQQNTGNLRLRSDKMLSSRIFQEMEEKLQKYLKECSQPDYLKKSDAEKKEHSSIIYKTDNLINRLKKANSDVHYLEDLTDVVIDQKDLNYVTHIARKFNFLERQISFLEIEFACWQQPAEPLLFAVRKLNQHKVYKGEHDWLKLVTLIYVRWLESKGYTYSIWELNLPGAEEEKLPKFIPLNFTSKLELENKIKERASTSMFVFYLQDGFLRSLLAKETGVHKLMTELPDEENVNHSQRLVSVFSKDIKGNISEALQEILDKAIKHRKVIPSATWIDAFGLMATGQETIVRSFKSNINRLYIEDFSAGLKTAEWEKVLNGELDPFILKRLRDKMFEHEE